MTVPALYFERVDIRRMPGFDTRGFSVSDLSSGVNIVYGPNASGKTTLSRAVALLLSARESKTRSVSLGAQVQVQGETRVLDCNHGRFTAQVDGREVDYQPFVPLGVEDKYLLALHDLLQAEDGDLALEIIREASGGFDLQAARESLGFRNRLTGTNTKVYKDLKAAIREHREAAREEDTLRAQEGTLAKLEDEAAKIQAARIRIEPLQRAIRVHQLRDAEAQAKAQVETFPDGVSALTGEESTQLRDNRDEREQLARNRAIAATSRETAERQLAESPLLDEGLGQEIVLALRSKLTDLDDINRRIDGQESAQIAAETERDWARDQLAGSVETPDTRATITVEMLTELRKLAQEEGIVHADMAAQGQLSSWLEQEDTADADSGALKDGLLLLTRWLAVHDTEPSEQAQQPDLIPWIVGAIATAVAGILLGWLVNLFWLVLIVVAIALIVYGTNRPKPQQKANPLPVIQREYAVLGVDQPDAWVPEDVQRLQRQVQEKFGAAAVQTERQKRWADLESRRKESAERVVELNQKREDLSRQLGLEAPAGLPELWTTVELLDAYFKADSASESARSTLDDLTGKRDALIQEVTEALTPFNLDAEGDAARLGGLVDRLEQMRTDHAEAMQSRDTAKVQLSDFDDRLVRLDTRISDVFVKLGLQPDEDAALSLLMDQREAFGKASAEHQQCLGELSAAEQAIAEWPERLERPVMELQTELDSCEIEAASHDEVQRSITEINTNINNARRKTSREEKLAQIALCEDALRDQRTSDQDDVVGSLLVDYLAEKERTRDRPGVFQRARQLFTDFTNGRYSLEMTDRAGTPEFLGFDTAENLAKPLEALSGGTRLQLLIAVRMAFLEHQERGGFKIPLLLDEALGNSDEKRADQIIETAIEICRQGRQVFYYTAQHDEVGKWERMLAEAGDVPHSVTDLARIRNFVESERVPKRPLNLPPKEEIPEPASMDWETYGGLLDIKPIAEMHTVGEVHLWYVIRDVNALYRLLSLEVNRWGQLENYVRNGTLRDMNADTPAFIHARALAAVIDQLLRLKQVGRGKPVDRQVLVDSGAVSDTFIDRITELAVRLNNDAEAAIRGLKAGDVERFSAKKRDDLEAYLQEHDFIDPNDVLSSEAIVEALRIRVMDHLQSELVTDDDLRWLVAEVEA